MSTRIVPVTCRARSINSSKLKKNRAIEISARFLVLRRNVLKDYLEYTVENGTFEQVMSRVLGADGVLQGFKGILPLLDQYCPKE